MMQSISLCIHFGSVQYNNPRETQLPIFYTGRALFTKDKKMYMNAQAKSLFLVFIISVKKHVNTTNYTHQSRALLCTAHSTAFSDSATEVNESYSLWRPQVVLTLFYQVLCVVLMYKKYEQKCCATFT